MNKKILATMLTVCICMTACGNNGTEAQTGTEQTTQQTTVQKEEQNAQSTTAQKEEQTTQPTIEQTTEQTVQGDDQSSKLMIENLLSLSGEYTDDVANNYIYSYELPMVSGVSTEYVGEVNTDIQKIKEMFIDSELQSMESKCSLECGSVRYTYDVYNGIYSLMIIVDYDYDQTFYYIYHFNEQGDKVENKELLEAVKMTEADFLKAETEILSEQTDYGTSVASSEFAEELKRARENTLSEENCNVNVPIYVDGEGTVSFVGTVYSIAGADSYDYFFTIQ